MDPIELDWQFTRACPGGPTVNGYVPPVGEHVVCYRPDDGEVIRCGVVDDNRAGLFLTCCDGRKVVLTAAQWIVHPVAACGGEAS